MISRQKLFLKATYSLEELVKKVRIRYLEADKNGTFSEVLQLKETAKWVTEQRHRNFGRCYTFYPEKYMQELGIYYIALEL